MSQERDVTRVNKDGTTATISVGEALESSPNETREEKKARLARILERGMVVDRLAVPLPDDQWGEWVPDNPEDIARKQLLGFSFADSEVAKDHALHSSADGKVRAGDTIFMVTSKENKEILDEIRNENYKKKHGKPDSKKKEQGEEVGFREQVIRELEMPVIDESKSSTIGVSEIQTAVKSTEAASG